MWKISLALWRKFSLCRQGRRHHYRGHHRRHHHHRGHHRLSTFNFVDYVGD